MDIPYRITPVGEYPAADKLPPMLANLYEFQRLQIENVAVVSVIPREGLPTLPQMRRHIANINRYMPEETLVVSGYHLPLVYQKDFIRNGIPYRELKSGSLYLPFMGLYYKGYTAPVPIGPLAQQLALYHIAVRNTKLYSQGLSELFQVTPMAISTALRTLADLPEFTRCKEGRRLYLETELTGAALFRQIRTRLFSPLLSRVYIKQEYVPEGAPLAGESALSCQTELAPPQLPCYAISKKEAAVLPTYEYLPAWDGYAQIELWRYSPFKLAKDGLVDPYSLLLTMGEVSDPRLQQAIDLLYSQLS